MARVHVPWAAAALAALVAAGCGRKPDPTPAAPANPTPPPTAPAKTPPDPRTRWVYDRGAFARGQGEAWFEHNDEAARSRGKPWEFRETTRTPDYVELYDASRGVTVRLADADAQARWDNDGKDAPWRPLMSGHWDRRE